MTDIVERLLVQSELGIMNCPEDHEYVTWGEAADEIERLRSALAFLYEATTNPEANTVIPAAIREARAALGGENV